MQYEQYLFWALQWGMVTVCAIVAGVVYIIGFYHGEKHATAEHVSATISDQLSWGRHAAAQMPRQATRNTGPAYRGAAPTVTQILPTIGPSPRPVADLNQVG